MSEYIENGITGLLVPPRDSEALAEAIIKALKNEQYLTYMEQNIKRIKSDDTFSWQSIASKYVKFFKS